MLKAMEDWYPLSIITPFAKLVDNVMGTDRNGFHAMHYNSHPDCSLSSFLLVNQRTGRTLPLTRLIDADQAIAAAADIAEKTTHRKRGARLYATARLISTILRIYRPENAPDGLKPLQLAKTVDAISGNRLLNIAKKHRYDWRLLFISSMHFQDAYNFQVDRVKRCTILYSTPEGRMVPFCTYNAGASFREGVEQRNSIPKAEWVRSRGSKYVTDGFVE
jgi:7,8-dihydro-6-hydroxymethylpterin dimethyltransferase